MESDEFNEKKDITSNLFRIAPAAQNAIKQALDVYHRLPIAKDDALLIQAAMALDNPVFSVDVPQQREPSETPATTDMMLKVAYTNKLELIRRVITREKTAATSNEIKEVLSRILRQIPDAV